MRAKRVLRQVAQVELVVETVDDENRVYVGTPELLALIEPCALRARRIDERRVARLEGREPNLEQFEREVKPAQIVADYLGLAEGEKAQHFLWIGKQYGIGKKRIKKILEANGVLIRPRRTIPVEDLHPDRAAKAIEVDEKGGSLEKVRRALGVGERSTALRFLRRNGRRKKQ